MDKVLNQVFDTLADKIKIAHAKDVASARATTSRRSTPTSATTTRWPRTPSAAWATSRSTRRGWASLNYDLYLSAWREAPEHPDHHRAPDEDDVPRAKKFLEDKMRDQGL